MSQLIRVMKLEKKFKWAKKYDDKYTMKDVAYGDQEVESEYLSGAFMLCNRNALDRVGWFSKEFFMYMEDADLTRKMSKLGKCLH